jgi:hypothetical protein
MIDSGDGKDLEQHNQWEGMAVNSNQPIISNTRNFFNFGFQT